MKTIGMKMATRAVWSGSVWALFFVVSAAAAEEAAPRREYSASAPEAVKESLAARVNAFYEFFQAGKFREAEAIVSEESREVFYNASKTPIRGYAVKRLEFTPDFKSAKALVTCKMIVPLMGLNHFDIPVSSEWNWEDGDWFVHFGRPRTADGAVRTPFGPMRAPSAASRTAANRSSPAASAAPRPTLESLKNRLRAARTELRMSADQFDDETGESGRVMPERRDAGRPKEIETAPPACISYGDRLYLGEQELASFEAGFDGWRLEGKAVTNHGRHKRYEGQQPISGNKSRGFLTSYHPDEGDRVTGQALSPEFAARADQHLVFLIAGGAGDGVGLRLLADGEEAAVWRGKNSERFETVVHPLAGVAGKRLQLEFFDGETDGWGHIMLDRVMLALRASELSDDAARSMGIETETPACISYGDRLYLGEQELASFEAGFDEWLLEGKAVTNHGRHERYEGQQSISGNKGRGFLTSYHPDKGDRVTGRALSPEFTARADQHLAFLIAGGAGEHVGLRLLADGEEAAVWRGKNSERFETVVHPLADVAGKRLQLELFDRATGVWGHIMLDHVMLARQGIRSGLRRR